jgi:hypothetical protein
MLELRKGTCPERGRESAMRTMWLIVDDPDGFDAQWEVEDPEPWEPIEVADEVTVGTQDDTIELYIGQHRAAD